MGRFHQLILLCIFLNNPSCADSKTISEQPYYKYRLALISQGWIPIKFSQRTDGKPLEFGTGDTEIMRSSGYTEVEKCTGVEKNFCFFIFRKKNICRIVTTMGEYSSDRKWPIAISFEDKVCHSIH